MSAPGFHPAGQTENNGKQLELTFTNLLYEIHKIHDKRMGPKNTHVLKK